MAKPALAYCDVCDCVFCPACWARQIPHRPVRHAYNAVPHEKIDYSMAMKIKDIFEEKMDDTEKMKLDAKDVETTWLGMTLGPKDVLTLSHSGRYADLMANNGPSGNFMHHKTRYPGLVSFVGQVGSGKSTVIKLLIRLSKDETGDFETPVVRSRNELVVPKSTDVHLYGDPTSMSSVHPILYAECEGFEEVNNERIGFGTNISQDDKSSGFSWRRLKSLGESKARGPGARVAQEVQSPSNFTNLHPRILYTFSDVVVFVERNPRDVTITSAGYEY
ncbi:hypothetical protein D0Z07_6642 [Hyphodiscus hymeniophilus]|uniref:Uncharacterized protein n=1 Tax=Hyphodiscus hymeniophilus TaxID=353542 RepID=A0A9P6VHD9_9HELO|nr:hypothetical protein D0Z07_6642 [Hyphodiscus hymeniophilus]